MANLESLCSQVIQGDLTALVPLVDELGIRGDYRLPELMMITGRLAIRAARLADQTVVDRNPNHRSRLGAAEANLRHEHQRLGAWTTFAEHFQSLFWAELFGKPLSETLARVQAALDTPAQAAQLNEEDDREAEPDDSRMSMGEEGAYRDSFMRSNRSSIYIPMSWRDHGEEGGEPNDGG